MIIEKVKSLSVLERYLYFINERESVRLKRCKGKVKPWTNDEIIQNYRFCNMRRMDDTVSDWLLENWYKPNFDHKNMVVACVMARHFNKPEVLEAVGFPKVWNPDKILEKVDKFKEGGGKPFNGAYIVRACKEYPDKAEMTVRQTCQPFIDEPADIDTDSMENSVAEVMNYHNLGSFMAGQVVADLRWALKGRWLDCNTWAAIGPGSRKGMNFFQGRDPSYPLKQSQFREELQGTIKLCEQKLPKSLTSRMEAIDYQNTFCEFWKYVRTLEGISRPKQKYPGV